MSQIIDLGKLRFNWAGSWASNIAYEVNDIVRHGGNTFVYIYGLKTSGNATTDTTYWALLQEGMSWQGTYDAATVYKPNQIVHHANNSYVCILEEPTAGNEPPNSTYWELLVTGFKFEGLYSNSTAYQVDDIIYYGANTYICIQNSAGGNNPEDTAFWSVFSHGLQWEGVYSNSTAYQKDDAVAYGANTYIAKQDTVGNLPTDVTNWDAMTTGISWQGIYNVATAYTKDDIVSYGANTFIAKNDTTGDLPTDTANWDALNNGISGKGDWTASTVYYKDDVITYGGQTFIALVSHSSTTNFATNLAAGMWSKFTDGLRWTGTWATATDYKLNDIVNNGGATYIVNTDHTSTTFAADVANWESFANAGTDVSLILQTQGDILYRNAASPQALNAGLAGQVLTTNGNGYNPSWATIDTGLDVAATLTTQGDLLIQGASAPERLATGTECQVLSSGGAGANPSWVASTKIDWDVITASANAYSGYAYIANTTASAFTLTLPSTPTDNDHILINDGLGKFSTNNLTIARSGNNIAGLSQDLVCDVDYSSFRLTFKTTIGWILT